MRPRDAWWIVMFDLHRLRLLRELKHRGTLTAVAFALSYATSTISQQLAQLESEAGVPLLEPDGRRVRLTPQAEILVAHTDAILEQLDQARVELIASLSEPTATVRVATFQSALLSFVPRTLELLRKECPQLRTHVVHMGRGEALSALLASDCDVVIDVEYPGISVCQTPELERGVLGEDRLHLALAGSAEAEATTKELSDFASHPWVMEPAGTDARRWATEICHKAGFEPDVRYESSDLLLHLRLVESGNAVGFLPSLIRRNWLPTVSLQPLPPHQAARIFTTTVRRESSRYPAIEAVRQALSRAYVQNLAR
ncbi:LysR substrate-binding domain-containing protein [Streptomyces collinus]|uniref:LysR substrate-binding domain-containing protein n=1 Tax=Streptomyces collinus TaxID=42684 RepID=UPI0036B9557F